jgi:hypothetical protein
MDLDLSVSSLFAGLITSAFGIYFIKRGKELGNILKILVGVGLLFDFLAPGIWAWVVGAVLMFVGFKA